MKKQKIEHLDLWKKCNSTNQDNRSQEIRNQLIMRYYPLVKKIAYKLSQKFNWKVSPEELTSFGVDGLIIAIGRFDTEKGVKFESYASTRIRGSMIDNMRKEDLIPRSVRLNNTHFEQIRSSLQSKQGRLVTDEEVSKELGLTLSEYNQNIKKYHPVIFSSLEGSDMSSDGENDMFKQDFNSNLISNNTPEPDSKIIRKEFFNKLLGNGFSPTERMIVYLYYYKNYTMDKISEKLKISESRVSQIHKNLLPRMKSKIERNPSYFSEHIEDFISERNDSEILF